MRQTLPRPASSGLLLLPIEQCIFSLLWMSFGSCPFSFARPCPLVFVSLFSFSRHLPGLRAQYPYHCQVHRHHHHLYFPLHALALCFFLFHCFLLQDICHVFGLRIHIIVKFIIIAIIFLFHFAIDLLALKIGIS